MIKPQAPRQPFTVQQLAYLDSLAETDQRPSITETEREIWFREGKIALVERLKTEAATEHLTPLFKNVRS